MVQSAHNRPHVTGNPLDGGMKFPVLAQPALAVLRQTDDQIAIIERIHPVGSRRQIKFLAQAFHHIGFLGRKIDEFIRIR